MSSTESPKSGSGAPAEGSALSYGRGRDHSDPAEYEAMDRLAKMFEHQVDVLQGKTEPGDGAERG